jgi:hypothetical protein
MSTEKDITQDILKNLKEKILEKMKELNITVSDLARMTDIKQPTLHKSLFLDRELSFTNSYKIINILNIDSILNEKKEFSISPIINEYNDIILADNIELLEEYVLIKKQNADDEIFAICHLLFIEKIFPQKSLILVNRKHKNKNLVFVQNELFTTNIKTNKIFGEISGIIFRKN